LLQVFESWGGELTPSDFNTFALPYLKQIVTKVKKSLKDLGLDVPMAVFARGSHYALEDLEKTMYDIVSLDWSLDPEQARKVLKTKTLQGNADPCLLYANPETIRTVTKAMVKSFGKKKWIANLGHGMMPGNFNCG
jgi:uroporphyrinogen decarboxylase